MKSRIGIRREDKNRWERRAPLVPEHVGELIRNNGLEVLVQSSEIRVFTHSEYTRVGAKVEDDLSDCSLILAIKEIPVDVFQPDKTYLFFSHTIKGQPYNMPMLRRMLDLRCQLIEYERVMDEEGRRLLFFGRYAGLAGMIDTLWALGKRLEYEGVRNPFAEVRQTHHYASLKEAREGIAGVGERIRADGLPRSLTPLVCGMAGYGNVSKGAQEILQLLPVEEVSPEDIACLFGDSPKSSNVIYKAVFKEEDMVEPISSEHRFELKDYYDHPEKYRSKFEDYLPNLTLLINCIYWESRYPRLVTKKYLKRSYADQGTPRLKVIGDISADVAGAVECTVRHTDPDNPVYVYKPFEDEASEGWEGTGPVILAVDNLPCELPRESSTDFSGRLRAFVPEVAAADFSLDFERCALPRPIKDAVIVYHGELTPRYRYLERYL